MSKQKMKIPGFEVLIIIVFFASFLIWAVPKCAKTANEFEAKAVETEKPEATETDKIIDSIAANLITAPGSISEKIDSAKQMVKNKLQATTPSTTTVDSRSILFITIDKLKLRSEPDLEADIVATLPLFEEVYFMDEVTEFTQQISLGYEIAEEPWIKVQTKKGKAGWVYGAGVHYYKKKRSGVME